MASAFCSPFKKSPSALSESALKEFDELRSKGKALAKNGQLEQACKVLKKAYDIRPSFKLKNHIDKIQNILKEYNSSLELIEIADGFHMQPEMHENLYPYQREAVLWMWGLYQKKKGGVLGDDMGLGKTIQIIAFLSSMFEDGHINSALLIMPVSLIENWKREFGKWAPDVVVKEYHAGGKKDRERSLAKVQEKGGVVLTTYGIVGKNFDVLRSKVDGRHFVWDYIVLDEGHKIKNPTKTTKAVHDIYAKHRIVLSGTPIQNNLAELWALYDFVHQGTLLGSLKTFKMQYETPIKRSREKDATQAERLLGNRISENLRTLIAPYFLRRTKQEILHTQDDKENADPSAFSRMKKDMMIRKNEFIVWVYLSPMQIKIYEDFLATDRVKRILVSQEKRSPLVELTVLKKICDHPRLLSHRSCIQLGLEGEMTEDEIEQALENDPAAYFDISNTPDQTLIGESGKLGVLFELLENLRAEGHRTLLFSLSCRILDIVQKVLKNRNWKTLRLDGKIRKTMDREKVISAFQNDSSYPILLLTTQVGGVGLTLTAADRVIIYDPSWNPATDAQAVDRAYRIGQTRSVVVYRLVTCGSIEEKIYRRQIFKDSITKQATGASADPHRYFTSQELKELFIMDDPKSSSTQMQLESLHFGQRKTDTDLDSHIAFLYSVDIFGISDHDLMFQGIAPEDCNEAANNSFVKEKVQQAQLLVQLESDQMEQELVKSGALAKPFTLPLNSTNKTSVNPIIDRHPTECEIPIVVEDLSQHMSRLDVKNESGDKKEREFLDLDNSEDEKEKKPDVSPYHATNQNGQQKEFFELEDSDDDVQEKKPTVNSVLNALTFNEQLSQSVRSPSGDVIEITDSDNEFQKSPFENASQNNIKVKTEANSTAIEPFRSSLPAFNVSAVGVPRSPLKLSKVQKEVAMDASDELGRKDSNYGDDSDADFYCSPLQKTRETSRASVNQSRRDTSKGFEVSKRKFQNSPISSKFQLELEKSHASNSSLVKPFKRIRQLSESSTDATEPCESEDDCFEFSDSQAQKSSVEDSHQQQRLPEKSLNSAKENDNSSTEACDSDEDGDLFQSDSELTTSLVESSRRRKSSKIAGFITDHDSSDASTEPCDEDDESGAEEVPESEHESSRSESQSERDDSHAPSDQSDSELF